MHVPASLAIAAVSLVLAGGGLAGVPASAAVAAVPAAAPPAAAATATASDRTVASSEVQRAAARLGKAERLRVIAIFKAAGATGKRPNAVAIQSARADVLADLPKGGYDVVSTYSRIPAVSLEVDAEALAALDDDPQVLAVQKDHVVRAQLTEAHAITGVNDVHTAGITGDGISVAIIDSGVDSAAGVVHPGLADDLLGQACFRTTNDCIGGPTSAEDQNGHGTHVAGIVTGPNGVAPDAGFYALKVFTTSTTSDTNILNALNHVIGLNSGAAGTVDLVNMSLGGASYPTAAACNAAGPAYKTAFSTLNSQDVTVFVATGNNASTTTVGAPACIDGAVGVGSTGDATFGPLTFSSCTDNGVADKVSCFSQATNVQGPGELVDILAPGCQITSLWLNEGTNTICGTSMATPYAVGTAALILESAAVDGNSLTPAGMETLLEETGVPITDYRIAGPTYPRVAPVPAIDQVDDAPTNLEVTGTTSTSVSLGWDSGADALSYELTRTNGTTGEVTTLASAGTGTTYTDAAAPCGPLSYVVRAVEAGGLNPVASNSVTPTARACPVAPTGVTVTPIDATSHTVAWTVPTPSNAVVVQRRLPGGSFADLATLGATATSTNDTPGVCGRVDYRVFTQATNLDRSAASPVVSRYMCAPANDDLANAEVVPVGSVGMTEPTDTEPNAKYASQEISDPAFTCHFGGAAKGYDGIWYAITAAADSRVSVSTATSTLIDPAAGAPDTLVAIYRGTPSELTELACNDDISVSNFRSTAVSNLKSGHSYYVHVAQWTDVPDSAAGNLVTTFTWSAYSAPANDEWEDAAEINTSPYTLSVPNAQTATTFASDPNHACRVSVGKGTHSLWWTFTPEFDGTMDLDTLTSSGSFADTLLSVYTGAPGSFTSVGCHDDISPSNFLSQISDLALTGGTTYSIQLSRWSATTTTTAGTAVLNTAFTVTPALQLSETALALEEGQPGETYTARLTAAPTADVTVTVAGDADCSASPTPLTFTTANYATPQLVTVTAIDDGIPEPGPDEGCAVTHTLASSDGAYNALTAPAVAGTVADLLVTGLTLTTPPDGASYTQGASVLADFECTDNRSGAGIDSCVGTVADGAAINTATVGGKSFTVTLTDVHGVVTTDTHNYTVTAPVVPPKGKPDARIAGKGPLVGDNVYGGSSQKKTAQAKRGKKAIHVVSLQNDATVNDVLKLLGTASGKGFKVKYLAPNGTKITAAVLAGTFSTPVLAPGATYDVKVIVKVTQNAKRGLKTKVSVSSVTTSTAKDAVFLKTKRKGL